jgi:hypothetical protein
VIGAQLWDPWYQTYLSSGLIVTGLTGTLSIDCLGVGWCSGQGTYLLSFLQPPLGDGSWLLYTNTPRYLVVSAEGLSPYARFINDNSVNLFQWSSSQVPVTFSTTRVPESLSLVLLSIGLSAVFVVAGRFGRKRNSAAD